MGSKRETIKEKGNTPEPAPRPKRMRASDRRRQILQTAQHVFAEENYENATTAKIAAAAGITEPTIYMHFKSKLELFMAVLEDSFNFIMDIFTQLWSAEGDFLAHYRQTLMQLNTLLNDKANIHMAKLWIIASTVNDPKISNYVAQFDKVLMNYITKDIKRAAKEGKIVLKYKPEVYARIFIGLVVNSTTMILAGSRITNEELGGVLDLLLDSLLEKTPPIQVSR
ncbi:MAG TPA: TetR/AcrR family transcriptional regulator [Deltaproteobacteria bacterium]|nr:TetR/AcrR family transcriptional regulator [Deltaproteobacteria bacterium]